MKWYTVAFLLVVLCAVLHQTTGASLSHDEFKFVEEQQGSLLREKRYNCPFCSAAGGPTGPARCNTWCKSRSYMMGECVGIKCECFNKEPGAV